MRQENQNNMNESETKVYNSDVESGNKNLTLSTIAKLEKAAGVSVGEILE